MFWIHVAFAALGLLLGFFVGGSETPVVSVAIPALAAVASAVMAMLTGRTSGSDFQRLLEGAQGSLSADERAELRASARRLVRRADASFTAVGVATLLFVVGYGAGALVGSYLRNSGRWAQAVAPLQGEWLDEGSGAHLDFVARADWLVYKQELRRAGATDVQIEDMFDAFSEAHRPGPPLSTPWGDGTEDAPPFVAVMLWLRYEPLLVAAGMTDEQIGQMWQQLVAAVNAGEVALSPQATDGSGEPADASADAPDPGGDSTAVGGGSSLDPGRIFFNFETPWPRVDPRFRVVPFDQTGAIPLDTTNEERGGSVDIVAPRAAE